jgi:hypothetical protein
MDPEGSAFRRSGELLALLHQRGTNSRGDVTARTDRTTFRVVKRRGVSCHRNRESTGQTSSTTPGPDGGGAVGALCLGQHRVPPEAVLEALARDEPLATRTPGSTPLIHQPDWGWFGAGRWPRLDPVDIDQVADQLYGMAPRSFTAARDAEVARAKKEGDRATADALKALRRPTVSAWLANLLVRQRSSQVSRLLSLGDQLRRAQAELAGEELRRLARPRHDAIAELCHEATVAAAGSGEKVSEAARRELEGTLEAAVADPDAAAALRSGRLTGALRYSGLGPTSQVGVTSARPAASRRPAGGSPTKARAPRGAPDPAVGRARAEATAAARRVRDLTTAAREAERALERVRQERAQAEDRVARLRAEEKERAGRARQAHKELEAAAQADARAQAELARVGAD